ncbi:MAG: type I 3-dehydroquinate dehydratase [Lachnospiraceae bacterium]|nr:type I 3-dehydroquinate dehydratase [Lachnospiraceae bacterium]
MSGIIEKKGKLLGHGKPVICVPVTEQKREEILREIRLLAEKKVDMIEWRVDWYENVSELECVINILEEIRPILKETLFLLTFRSKVQGGNRQLAVETIVKLNEAAAKTGVPDFIDMEYFEYEKPKKEIQRIKNCGVFVITSHHDFERTPESEILQIQMEKMYQSGADIVKLAVMPNSRKDVLNLLYATENFVEIHPDTPIITMSMGKEGMISRLCGEVFGSCVTFGSHRKSSAPGQMQMDDLEIVLEKIHKSIC